MTLTTKIKAERFGNLIKRKSKKDKVTYETTGLAENINAIVCPQ